jgi:hypothetical protein
LSRAKIARDWPADINAGKIERQILQPCETLPQSLYLLRGLDVRDAENASRGLIQRHDDDGIVRDKGQVDRAG